MTEGYDSSRCVSWYERNGYDDSDFGADNVEFVSGRDINYYSRVTVESLTDKDLEDLPEDLHRELLLWWERFDRWEQQRDQVIRIRNVLPAREINS